MNKKAILFCLILFSSMAFAPHQTPMGGHEVCSIENTSFVAGERLVYKAYYNWKFVWIPAGEAVFDVIENKNDYEVRVIGKTYESYDYFFKVRDYFYSKIDKTTLYPKNFVRIIEEGDYRKFDSISFDQVRRKAYSYNGKTRATAKLQQANFDECMHDLLSVLYYLRNVNVDQYKKGTYIPTQVYFDNEKYPIKVRYEGREQKKEIKELGTYNTVKVIPDLVVGNVFKDGDKMKIWVSDDANKVPLLIESPLKIGSAKAVLKSYKGLRYKLSSKIE